MPVNIKKKGTKKTNTPSKGNNTKENNSVLPSDNKGGIHVGEGTLMLDGNPIGDIEELEMQINQPSANLSVEYSDGTVKNLNFEVKQASAYIGPTVNVGISLAFTKNTGNYENVKAQVSIHVPCAHEEIEDTYEFIKGWAEEKINEINQAEDED